MGGRCSNVQRLNDVSVLHLDYLISIDRKLKRKTTNTVIVPKIVTYVISTMELSGAGWFGSSIPGGFSVQPWFWKHGSVEYQINTQDISFKSAEMFWNIFDSVMFELASFSQEIRDCSGLYGCVCLSRGKCMCMCHEDLNANTVFFLLKSDVCCKSSVSYVSKQNNSTKCSHLLIFWSEKWQKRSQSNHEVITNSACLKKQQKMSFHIGSFPLALVT